MVIELNNYEGNDDREEKSSIKRTGTLTYSSSNWRKSSSKLDLITFRHLVRLNSFIEGGI